MAVKSFKKAHNIKVNIILRDGKEYLGCDVPVDPLPEYKLIRFWQDNALINIPMDLVKEFALYEDNGE